MTVDLDKTDVPVVDDDQHGHLDNATHELLMWHYRLGHAPFAKIQSMARAGDLPKRISNCRVPECAACRFGRATKIPWQT